MAERRTIHTACAEFMCEVPGEIPGMWRRLTRDGAADMPLTVHVLYADGGSGCYGDQIADEADRDAVIAHARVMATRRPAIGAVVLFEACMDLPGTDPGEQVETLVLLLQMLEGEDLVYTWPIWRAAGVAALGERERLELAAVDIDAYDVLHSPAVEH
jgi:hypothetical protein